MYVYTLTEVSVFYIECKAKELERVQQDALATRVGGTDKNGWDDYIKKSEAQLKELRKEFEGGDPGFKNGQNVDAFFKGLMPLVQKPTAKAKT